MLQAALRLKRRWERVSQAFVRCGVDSGPLRAIAYRFVVDVAAQTCSPAVDIHSTSLGSSDAACSIPAELLEMVNEDLELLELCFLGDAAPAAAAHVTPTLLSSGTMEPASGACEAPQSQRFTATPRKRCRELPMADRTATPLKRPGLSGGEDEASWHTAASPSSSSGPDACSQTGPSASSCYNLTNRFGSGAQAGANMLSSSGRSLPRSPMHHVLTSRTSSHSFVRSSLGPVKPSTLRTAHTNDVAPASTAPPPFQPLLAAHAQISADSVDDSDILDLDVDLDSNLPAEADSAWHDKTVSHIWQSALDNCSHTDAVPPDFLITLLCRNFAQRTPTRTERCVIVANTLSKFGPFSWH